MELHKTYLNLPISTKNPDCINAIQHFIQEIISYGTHAIDVINTAKNYPDCVLVQIFSAIIYLYGQTKENDQQALYFLHRAKKYLSYANQRENLYYHAASAWHELNYKQAQSYLHTILKHWPEDTLAIKLIEWLYYVTGQAYNAKPFLKTCETILSKNKNNPYFLSTYSFALELSNNLKQARSVAEKSITLEKINPWAHHTLSHVYLNEGKVQEGIRLLQNFQPIWENILPTLAGHNNWHLALFHIANRDQNQALSVFDGKVWGSLPDILLQQFDAISLLWRLDMAGFSIDQFWPQIVKHIDGYYLDHYQPFNNAHHIYALAKTNNKQATTAMQKELSHYANQLKGDQYVLWHDIALPLLRGCELLATQAYQDASQTLAPIIDSILRVGGSDAQCELFFQAYCYSLLKSNQKQSANKLINNKLAHYINTPLGQYWLGL